MAILKSMTSKLLAVMLVIILVLPAITGCEKKNNPVHIIHVVDVSESSLDNTDASKNQFDRQGVFIAASLKMYQALDFKNGDRLSLISVDYRGPLLHLDLYGDGGQQKKFKDLLNTLIKLRTPKNCPAKQADCGKGTPMGAAIDYSSFLAEVDQDPKRRIMQVFFTDGANEGGQSLANKMMRRIKDDIIAHFKKGLSEKSRLVGFLYIDNHFAKDWQWLQQLPAENVVLTTREREALDRNHMFGVSELLKRAQKSESAFQF